MNFTIDFSKALRVVCITSVLLLLPIIGLQFQGMDGFSMDKDPEFVRTLLNQIIYSIPKLIFWWAVFYVSKDKKASLVGGAIAIVGQVVITYLLLTKAPVISISNIFYWNDIIFSIAALATFGWLHFQKNQGLYLGLVALIISGIAYGMNSYEYHKILDSMFELFGMRDGLSFRIPTGENSYSSYRPFLNFLYLFSYPMGFIVFWFGYDAIKREQPFDISLRTVTLYEQVDKNTYAIVHWVLRMVLVMVMIGSLSFMARLIGQGFLWTSLLKSLNFCFAIYVIAALYRNTLLAFYSTKKSYPSWFYIFLNIPYVHFIFWSYLFFMKKRQKTFVPAADILDEIKPEIPLLGNAEDSQKRFVKDEKNNGIKVLIIIVAIFGAVMQVLGFNNSMLGFPIESQMLTGLFSFISLGLTIWYMSDEKALYPIFIIQSIAIIATLVVGNEMIMGVTAMAGLVNLVVYYPLFHYDRMRFRREELE